VIVAEVVAGRMIWVRAILEPSESRRAAETNQWWLSGMRDAIRGSLDSLNDDYGYGIRYGCGFFILIIIALLWASQTATHFVMQFCDSLFSGAGLLPAPPFFLWSVWGALFGAVLGYWHVAPLHNLGRWRGWFVAGLIAMLFLLYLCGMSR
jgi:hypothetical protein